MKKKELETENERNAKELDQILEEGKVMKPEVIKMPGGGYYKREVKTDGPFTMISEIKAFEDTIPNRVRLAQLRGTDVANSTYLEALRTVIEFARPLTLEESCSITGWISKTVSNRLSEIRKGKQKQEYRGVPYFKRGGGPLFRIEDILRYMGAFEPDPLHRQMLDRLAPQGKDAKE
jgi:hypothetical protein